MKRKTNVHLWPYIGPVVMNELKKTCVICESFMLEEFDKQIVDGEDEKLLAYVLQLSMERFMIDLIRNEFFESIVKHDNNLIITYSSH